MTKSSIRYSSNIRSNGIVETVINIENNNPYELQKHVRSRRERERGGGGVGEVGRGGEGGGEGEVGRERGGGGERR